MIGDGEIAVAERPRRADHHLRRVAAVAPQRVRVEIALDVGHRDRWRERAALRERDLVEAMPAFRRNPGQIQRRVDVGFGGRRPDAAVAVDEAPRRQPQAAGAGALGELRDVLTRAAVVHQRGAERRVGDRAQGDLLAVPHERDGVAAAPADIGGREAVRPCRHRGRRTVAGGEDQQIADGRLEPPQPAGRIQRQPRLRPFDRLDEQVDRAQGAAEQQPRLAGPHLGKPRRHVARRAVVPRRREIGGHVHAVLEGEAVEESMLVRAMPARSRGSLALGVRHGSGRASAEQSRRCATRWRDRTRAPVR